VAEASEPPSEQLRNIAMTLVGHTSKTLEAYPTEEFKTDATSGTLSPPEKSTPIAATAKEETKKDAG